MRLRDRIALTLICFSTIWVQHQVNLMRPRARFKDAIFIIHYPKQDASGVHVWIDWRPVISAKHNLSPHFSQDFGSG